MSVLIGGGSGFVGRHLTKMLTEYGLAVTSVSRTTGPNKITWADLSKDGLPEGCSAVVSMSGANFLTPFRRWNFDLMKENYSSRVDCTKALSDAIRQSTKPPKVFVCMSTVSCYKPKAGAEYDEDSQRGKFDYLSELSAHWEAATALPKDVDCRKVIVRSGTVLGDGGVVKHLYWPFFLGVGGRIGSGQQWFPWIHVHDLAGIITHAILNNNVSGILNAVSPNAATNVEFTKKFASALRRPAVIPVPDFLTKLLYNPEMSKVILTGPKVVPKRTLESGYKFAYPDLELACINVREMFKSKNVS